MKTCKKPTKKELLDFGMQNNLVCIGEMKHIVKTTDKAILFCIGKTYLGLPIEVFFPITEVKVYQDNLFVPLWLAKNKGVGWYLEDNFNNDLPFGFKDLDSCIYR